MSATLRLDIGIQIGAAIQSEAPDLAKTSDLRQVLARWKGATRGGHAWVYTLAFRLPDQLAEAVALLLLADRIADIGDDACSLLFTSPNMVRRSARSLAANLRKALGLPEPPPPSSDEAAFLAAIDADPGEPVRWLVYADWLRERSDPEANRRGHEIAAILGPKTVKFHYGRPDLGEES